MARTVKTNRASPYYIEGLSIPGISVVVRLAAAISGWLWPPNVADEFLERKPNPQVANLDAISMSSI